MATLLCVAMLLGPMLASAASVTINVDAGKTTQLNHFWKECVGSGHALLGTRRDWLAHLENVTRDIGFEQVRFHGVFDDDMSVLQHNDSTPNLYNVFVVYDAMLAMGVKPLVELSFMPSKLVTCKPADCSYAFNNPVSGYKGLIMPPDNFNDWYKLVYAFATQLVKRYGLAEVRTWKFEVWNELWGMPFPSDYMALYNASALAVKAVDSQLAVGGPATMQVQNISAFVDLVQQMGLPCDFVSTHLYPTDPNCMGSMSQDADCFANTLLQAQSAAQPFKLLVTEMNDGLGDIATGGEFHRDKAYGAAFLLHNIPLLTSLPLMSWWTFTDVFEEGGMLAQTFHNGFGLQTITGVAKPVYRAFELLRDAGDKIAASDVSASDGIVSVLPTVNSTTGEVRLYLSNFRRLDMSPIAAATITVHVSGTKLRNSTGHLIRLDDQSLTAVAAWQAMGSPDYPTAAQTAALMKASQTTTEPLPLARETNAASSFTITLQANTAAVVILN